MKKDTAFAVILGIIIIFVLCAVNTHNENKFACKFVKELPKPILEYIHIQTGFDTLTVSGQLKIYDYYLQNFYEIEDKAYEYNWYN